MNLKLKCNLYIYLSIIIVLLMVLFILIQTLIIRGILTFNQVPNAENKKENTVLKKPVAKESLVNTDKQTLNEKLSIVEHISPKPDRLTNAVVSGKPVNSSGAVVAEEANVKKTVLKEKVMVAVPKKEVNKSEHTDIIFSPELKMVQDSVNKKEILDISVSSGKMVTHEDKLDVILSNNKPETKIQSSQNQILIVSSNIPEINITSSVSSELILAPALERELLQKQEKESKEIASLGDVDVSDLNELGEFESLKDQKQITECMSASDNVIKTDKITEKQTNSLFTDSIQEENDASTNSYLSALNELLVSITEKPVSKADELIEVNVNLSALNTLLKKASGITSDADHSTEDQQLNANSKKLIQNLSNLQVKERDISFKKILDTYQRISDIYK